MQNITLRSVSDSVTTVTRIIEAELNSERIGAQLFIFCGKP